MLRRCAVFASGGGSNFGALIDRKIAGDLHLDFNLLVCNNPRAGAIERANKQNIPSIIMSPSHFASEEEYCRSLLTVLREYSIEFIILAGYMKKVPRALVREYPLRIVNIHPALLPAFGGKGMYGSHVHEAVIAYGARITGITVHFVDEEYDHGPIILQAAIDVLDSDDPCSLAKRVLSVEHAEYWRAIEQVVQGQLEVSGQRIFVKK